jgi:hypothetical protein
MTRMRSVDEKGAAVKAVPFFNDSLVGQISITTLPKWAPLCR